MRTRLEKHKKHYQLLRPKCPDLHKTNVPGTILTNSSIEHFMDKLFFETRLFEALDTPSFRSDPNTQTKLAVTKISRILSIVIGPEHYKIAK